MVQALGGLSFISTNFQAPQNFQNRFDTADSDGSGGISIDEFEAAIPQRATEAGVDAESVFSNLDADADGQLTETELQDARSGVQDRILESIQSGGLSSSNVLQLIQSGQSEVDFNSFSPQSFSTGGQSNIDSLLDVLNGSNEGDEE